MKTKNKMLSKIRDWYMQGESNDVYYSRLSRLDKHYYMIGQKTFLNSFYRKHRQVLEEFVCDKIGKDYVEGVVQRGKYLRKQFPIRSSCFNIVDFLFNIHNTFKTGPDPETRRSRN